MIENHTPYFIEKKHTHQGTELHQTIQSREESKVAGLSVF